MRFGSCRRFAHSKITRRDKAIVATTAADQVVSASSSSQSDVELTLFAQRSIAKSIRVNLEQKNLTKRLERSSVNIGLVRTLRATNSSLRSENENLKSIIDSNINSSSSVGNSDCSSMIGEHCQVTVVSQNSTDVSEYAATIIKSQAC
jgi:tRNA pseudouridine-54 N-methylase